MYTNVSECVCKRFVLRTSLCTHISDICGATTTLQTAIINGVATVSF